MKTEIKKRIFIWAIGTAVVMLGLPVVMRLLPGSMGFVFSILLFFTIDPLFAFATGLMAGCNLRELWWTPIATGAAFLAGAWIFIEPLETDFLIYTVFYIAVGAIVMGFTQAIRKAWAKRKEREAAEKKYRR